MSYEFLFISTETIAKLKKGNFMKKFIRSKKIVGLKMLVKRLPYLALTKVNLLKTQMVYLF